MFSASTAGEKNYEQAAEMNSFCKLALRDLTET